MTSTGPQPPRDPRIDEREWRWQERARASRVGASAGDDTDAIEQYRRIDAALRQPPAMALPADFAAALAMRVRSEQRDAARVERRMIAGLVLALVVCGTALLAFNADAFATQLRAALGQHGVPWALALGACVLMSVALDAMRRRSPAGMPRGT